MWIKIYGITLAVILSVMLVLGFYFMFASIPLSFSLTILGLVIGCIIGLVFEVTTLIDKIKAWLSKLPKFVKKLLGIKL